MAKFYTIQERDVGQPILKAFGLNWLTSSFIGQILPLDVGKRVYRMSGSPAILQVENNEQRDKRLS